MCTVEYFSNIVIKKECISIAEGFLKGYEINKCLILTGCSHLFRLDKSLALHYKQYVFLLAPLLGSEELLILTELQERYVESN